MKKILFVINTLGLAGAEKALTELLNVIDAKEYEVSLYVLMGQGEMRERIAKHVTLLNKDYDDTPIHGAEGKKHLRKKVLRRLFGHGAFFKLIPYHCVNLFRMLVRGNLKIDKLLWRAMAMGADRFDEEYDLAVAYIEGGAAYYVRDYVKAKKKAAFIHIDYKEAGYYRELDRCCYRDFDRIFPVSDEVKDVFNSVYPECADKTEVFHNILNIAGIRAKAEENADFALLATRSAEQMGISVEKHERIRLLTVGRLNSQKGFENSIAALKLLVDGGTDAEWYILGEGDLREYLTNEIKKNGLEERFFLPGNVMNPYPYMKHCDIYVHATRFEGKSIAIQEAQVLGCTLVVSDCSGNREQVADGIDGRLCDMNPAAIAAVIGEVLSDRAAMERMASQAYRKLDNVSDETGKLLNLIK